ncbi:Ig-like domain-containing domain [Geodermatophilus marinus]|uniref:Ig-like domain-containing protein n=1 Tax=Geodermatophilus sp. LHW52908 TaxID=2303986 RepID=UPI001314EFC1|nr:Ig-like domain-containing protein [Geodermatophilus sp. LHW52908]
MVLAALVTVVGLAPAASAAYSPEPVGPAWVPDGGVHAVAVSGGVVYVGGSFTGGVAALTADTGQLIWRGTANGDVRALALTTDGSHLLLGGAFTTVGGTTHRKLASVHAGTGAVDNTFRGTAGGTVRDIVVVGNTAYFGGAFTQHGGMAQQGLGAVDATTGALVSSFTASANGTVYALGTDGSRLFIGGGFTTVDGQPRNQLASVTLSSHSLDSWAPARACTGCNLIWDLTVGGNRVYTVGRNAGTGYTVDKNTGAFVLRVTGGVNGDSQAVTLSPDGRTLYIGGHFVTVAGQTRMLVAEFDVSGNRAVLGPFSTRFVTSYPGVWAMASTSSRLYVGGDFTAAGSRVGGQNRYPYFAIFPDASADSTAPAVTATDPADGATGVPTTTPVTATFGEPVQNVTTGTFTLTTGGTTVPAAVSYDGTGNVATLQPAAALTAGTTYTATLSTAITDAAGNPLPATSWSFTTAPAADTTPPAVTATTPADGATGVPTTTPVTATFGEPVQNVTTGTFTLTTGGATVPAAVSYDGTGNVATLQPAAALTAGTTYTATLSTAITDAAGNPLPATSWSFTTAPAAGDGTAPTITAASPADGAVAVGAATNVVVTFSERVMGVDAGLTLTPAGGAPVSAALSSNSAGTRWVLNPDANLAADTRYTVQATSAVTDASGTALAPVSWTFLTGPAPRVTLQIPAAGATGVDPAQPVTVAFSEAVQNVTAATVTLTAGGSTVDATVTPSGTEGRRWILTPSAPLSAGTTYTATVAGGADGVTDLAGNPLADTVTWTFTTA